MKLNESYLGVYFETNRHLKDFFLGEHLHSKHKFEVGMMPLLAKLNNGYYDRRIDDPWEARVSIANRLCESPRNLKRYFITKTVQEGADLIKFDLDKVDLRMFKVLPNMQCLYIPNKDEMFRFEKNDHRINVLYYHREHLGLMDDIKYDSYSVILEDEEIMLGMLPGQDKDAAVRLLKLILFIEVGEISFTHCRAHGGKVVFGKGGDDKLKNESGVDVTVVNSNWNRMVIVQGGYGVRGHFKMIWCGEGRKKLERRWWSAHSRGTHVRVAGRINEEKKH
jgi:hypothetical protein